MATPQPSLGGEPVVATSDVADVVATDDAADAVADLTEKTSNLDIAEPETAAQPSASQDGAISPQGNPVVPWPGNTKKKPLRNKNAVKKSSRPGSGRNNKRAGIVMGMTAEEYSSRNLYLRALPVDTTDESLYEMCIVFGKIVSAKAIMEKFEVFPRTCKGYGFVLFEAAESAAGALTGLSETGVEASYARVSTRLPKKPSYPSAVTPHPVEDPTNLYFSNLPASMSEKDLEGLLRPYGVVVSSRILRYDSGASRGVGFARMKTRAVCVDIVQAYNGKLFEGSADPVLCKFADNPGKGPRRKFQRDGYFSNDQVYPAGAAPLNAVQVQRYPAPHMGMGMMMNQQQNGQMPLSGQSLYVPMAHGTSPYSETGAPIQMMASGMTPRQNQQMMMQYAPYYGWSQQPMYIPQQAGLVPGAGASGMGHMQMVGQMPDDYHDGSSPADAIGQPIGQPPLGFVADPAVAGAPTTATWVTDTSIPLMPMNEPRS